MSLPDYAGLFGTMMIFILLIWDQVSIYRLSLRMSAVEQNIHQNRKEGNKDSDQRLPSGYQETSNGSKNACK